MVINDFRGRGTQASGKALSELQQANTRRLLTSTSILEFPQFDRLIPFPAQYISRKIATSIGCFPLMFLQLNDALSVARITVAESRRTKSIGIGREVFHKTKSH